MPTPIFNFRLPTSEANQLREVSRVYGAANPSVFLREMVGALCSGDSKRIGEFNARLLQKMGEQLAFDFAQQAARQAAQTIQKPRKREKKGRGATKHAKRV